MLPLFITVEMVIALLVMILLMMTLAGVVSFIVNLYRSVKRTRSMGLPKEEVIAPPLLSMFHRDDLRLANNPIILKEMRETIATKRAVVIFGLFTAVMALTVWLAWPRGAARVDNIDLISERLFQILGTSMLTMVCLLAPAHSATAITGEKERDCFDLLVTSGITPLQIMLGKLISALVFIGLLILGSAPMISVCLLLGGTSPQELFALFLVLFDSMVLFSLLGLSFSCLFQRNNASLGVTYVISLPLLGIVFLFRDALFTVQGCVLVTIGTLFVSVIALNVLALSIRRPPELRDEEEEDDDPTTQATPLALKLDRRLIPDKWLAPPRRITMLPDKANPVLDKEIRSELVGQGTLMLRLILQAGCVLTLFPFTILYLIGQPAWYFLYVMIFTMLIAPSFTSGMVTGERENGTFELLVTTLATPRMIIGAKVIAGLRLVLTMLGIMIIPTLPGIVIGSVNVLQEVKLSNVIGSALLCLGWAMLLVLISLMWSMVSRRTTAALIASYVSGVAILFGPNLLHLVIRGFTTVEAPWLENFLVISPLTHLFSLTPGSISPSMVPGMLTPVTSLLYGIGLFAVCVGMYILMVKSFEHIWRRWLGFGGV